MLIDQWLYLPQPGYGGAWCWTPVAWCDKSSGQLYPLLPGLTVEECERQWTRASRRLRRLRR